MSEQKTCPGYERKSWFNRTCTWFKEGSWGWVGSSSFCDHPERKIAVCLSGGRKPKDDDSQ